MGVTVTAQGAGPRDLQPPLSRSSRPHGAPRRPADPWPLRSWSSKEPACPAVLQRVSTDDGTKSLHAANQLRRRRSYPRALFFQEDRKHFPPRASGAAHEAWWVRHMSVCCVPPGAIKEACCLPGAGACFPQLRQAPGTSCLPLCCRRGTRRCTSRPWRVRTRWSGSLSTMAPTSTPSRR